MLALLVAGCDASAFDGPSDDTTDIARPAPTADASEEKNGYVGSVVVQQSIVSNEGVDYFQIDAPGQIFYLTGPEGDDGLIIITCGTEVTLANGNSFDAEANQVSSDATVAGSQPFFALIPRGLTAAAGGAIEVTRTCVTTSDQRTTSASFSDTVFLLPQLAP